MKNKLYLRDNTEHHGNTDTHTADSVKITNKYSAFLKKISSCSIEKLNEDGNILVWPHSFKDCDGDFAKMKILEYNDNEKIIHTTNLVGFIGEDNVEIEITSRFSESGNEQDFFLYYMLSKIFSANIVNMEVGGGSLKELDLLLFVFPRLLKSAMQQGLYKEYVKKEYNDSNVRGIININQHIRYNNPPNGRIAYTTREFSYDNDITQLIRHTIEYMSTIPMGRTLLNSDKEIERYVRQIVQVTPLYQKGERRRIITANRIPLSHPYYNRYKALQQICLAILRKEKMSHGSNSNQVHGLLIDIAWLWEEYIANILQEHNAGFNHYTGKNSFKLFSNVDSNKSFQTVIPDYLHENNFVADAKYIPLHRYEHLDAERASAVYYKTIMYMYRFATSKGFLFHPCSVTDENENSVAYSEYEIANNNNCYLYKIGLVIPECNNFAEFKQGITDNETEFCEIIKKLTT